MADDTYLVFISTPGGYELVELSGRPPAVGEDFEHGDVKLRVMKVAPSPLPSDDRVCAYSEPL